jgi:hypothetical protein
MEPLIPDAAPYTGRIGPSRHKSANAQTAGPVVELGVMGLTGTRLLLNPKWT